MSVYRAFLAILYYLIVVVGMLILGIPYIIYKGYIRGHREEITNVCQFFFTRIAFKLFHITLKIEGEENIPKGRKGFVIVANHQSFLDINVLWPAIGNAAFMAKASLWKAPIFGWVISTIGCIPVHKNPRKNAGMGKMVAERLAKGYNFTVFPEGHRTEDGHMLKFQNGIFRHPREHGRNPPEGQVVHSRRRSQDCRPPDGEGRRLRRQADGRPARRTTRFD